MNSQGSGFSLCNPKLFLLFRPQNGSMILYNRKKVKYRKDGYCWKKRKDGKTTREDHMKLKVQGVEVGAGGRAWGRGAGTRGPRDVVPVSLSTPSGNTCGHCIPAFPLSLPKNTRVLHKHFEQRSDVASPSGCVAARVAVRLSGDTEASSR